MDHKLFAVYLGGRAARCNTELHDVVFVVGDSIEATYEQLMDKWFGDPLRLHIDSWMELRIIDGQRIVLRAKSELLRGTQSVHTDDLYDIDDCLEIAEVDGHHIHLEPTADSQPFAPNNGYHIFPKPVVAAYAASRKLGLG